MNWRREYGTNLGEKRRTRGGRGYMMKTRGGEKEGPDGGQEEDRGGAPHGRSVGWRWEGW